MIPESTRTFFGYLLAATDYKTFTWEELGAAANLPIVNSPLNGVESLASSADDFVSYYSRALQGEFFQNKATLNEFRRILAMGNAIWLLPMPLGVSAFVKGGSIDVPGFHAVCAPGGMLFNNRWVYFCLTFNWYAKAETDTKTLNAFAAAASRALGLVKDALSAWLGFGDSAQDLPTTDPANVHVDEIRSAVVAHPAPMQCESGIAQLGSGHARKADINCFGLHVQTVLGDSSVRAAGTQKLIRTWSSIPADNIDLGRGMTEGSGQFVQQVKHAGIVVVDVASAIVAQVLVEAVECLRQIRVAPAVHDVEPLVGMGMVKP